MYRYIFIYILFLFTQSFFIANAQKLNYPIQVIDGQEYYLYTVQKSEGWFRISKHFDVSQNVLKEANPEVTGGLELGTVLRVPVKSVPEQQNTQLTANNECIIHIIAPQETIYGISRKYGISQETLIAQNPEVTKKMAIGDKLIISKKEPTKPKEPVNKTVVTITQPLTTDTNELVHHTDTTQSIAIPIRIAYLLPFMADAAKNDPTVDKFVEFYEGALLAINDAKKQGTYLEIYTFDVEKNDIKIQSILSNPVLETMDLIIGPAYSAQVKYVSDFAFNHKIKTVIPFTSDVSDISINPYLYQFNPTFSMESDILLQKITTNTENHAVLFVNIAGQPVNSQTIELQKSLKEDKIKYKEITINTTDVDTLQNFLDNTKINTIILGTPRYQLVRTIIMAFNDLQKQFDIELIGNYSWVTHQKEIKVPMYYTALFYQNEAQIVQTNYLKHYDTYYGHPLSTQYPRYDMLGYDLTTYFISALNVFGTTNMSEQIKSFEKPGLQSSPLFMQKNELSGFINKGIYLLKTDKEQTTRVNY